MDIKIELKWTRAEIEALLEKDAREKGFIPVPATEGVDNEIYSVSPFDWGQPQFSGTGAPLIQVKAMATQGSPAKVTLSATSVMEQKPIDIPPDSEIARFAPPTNRAPSRGQRILTSEEIEELAKLLPDPSYSNQVLNTKAVVRDLMPGETKDRPD